MRHQQPTSRAPFKSFFEGQTATHLVAFFMQTIKEIFCSILKCSFRILRVFSFCKIEYDYWHSV